MKKIFKDLNIGEEFSYGGKVFIKIPPEKISCCRSFVAVEKDNPAAKATIHNNAEVETIDDQPQ